MQNFSVGDEPVEESLAGFIVVGVVALPSEEGGILKGTGEGKGDRPREGAIFGDFGEVVGGLLGGLTAR